MQHEVVLFVALDLHRQIQVVGRIPEADQIALGPCGRHPLDMGEPFVFTIAACHDALHRAGASASPWPNTRRSRMANLPS